MNAVINSEAIPDIKYGIKFAMKNIGFNGKIYTFPYFLIFLLKRFLAERKVKAISDESRVFKSPRREVSG